MSDTGAPEDGSSDLAAGAEVHRSARSRSAKRVWVPYAVAGALVVIVVALWAARSTGERPSLGSGAAEESNGEGAGTSGSTADTSAAPGTGGAVGAVVFSPGTEPFPSGGCDAPSAAPQADLVVDSQTVASAAFVPPAEPAGPGTPSPLIVVISEAGLSSEDLENLSGTFATAGTAYRVGVSPVASDPVLVGRATAALIGELINTQCIDMSRINLVGFGSGAASAATVICEAPGLVSGVAMVAGLAGPACDVDPPVAVRIQANGDDPSIDSGTALLEVGSSWANAQGLSGDTVDGRDEDTIIREWTSPDGLTVRTLWNATGGHNWTLDSSVEVGPFIAENARSR